MCEYCEFKKVIMKDKIKIYSGDQRSDIFIDRGYLRCVHSREKRQLNYGSRIKIKFCFFCGNPIKAKK